jgi:hypothetical protein
MACRLSREASGPRYALLVLVPLWRSELTFWRNKLYRERGGPVRLRIAAISDLDRALEFLENAEREGRVQPDAVWGVLKN